MIIQMLTQKIKYCRSSMWTSTILHESDGVLTILEIFMNRHKFIQHFKILCGICSQKMRQLFFCRKSRPKSLVLGDALMTVMHQEIFSLSECASSACCKIHSDKTMPLQGTVCFLYRFHPYPMVSA